MASPERGPGDPDQSAPHEREPVPYHRAAQFVSDQLAGSAYRHARDAIYRDPGNEISVYRMRVNLDWFVAAIGETPPDVLAQQLDRIFAAGVPATLPPEVLQMLAARRAEQRQFGPWVERRHRPGKQF